MSNLLGEMISARLPKTLGAVRRVKDVSWLPGAEIDVWSPCASMPDVTGVPWPHIFFVQTIGSASGARIHCPHCEEERREKGVPRPVFSLHDPETEVFA